MDGLGRLADQAVQVGSGDCQFSRSQRLVAITLRDSLIRQIDLELLQQLVECLRQAIARLFLRLQASGKVAPRDTVAVGHDDGALNQVLQFANIARPVVRH
jgi:hypothetical protein